jgi:predicted amidophosphoribosyltransferase
LAARRVKETGWPEFSAVVPVPLHQSKLKERGFDQALLLARAVGSELGLPVQPVLQRVRSTPSQTKLGAEMRWQNVAGAFLALPGERVGGNLLLVDDLLTTGATAHNAALPLLAAGAGAVYLAVVAVAPGTS